jgi:hypothetical protein
VALCELDSLPLFVACSINLALLHTSCTARAAESLGLLGAAMNPAAFPFPGFGPGFTIGLPGEAHNGSSAFANRIAPVSPYAQPSSLRGQRRSINEQHHQQTLCSDQHSATAPTIGDGAANPQKSQGGASGVASLAAITVLPAPSPTTQGEAEAAATSTSAAVPHPQLSITALSGVWTKARVLAASHASVAMLLAHQRFLCVQEALRRA